MHSHLPHSGRLRRLYRNGRVFAGALLIALLVSSAACRRGRGQSMPSYLSDDPGATRVDPSQLDPALARKWEALQHAWGTDPNDDQIVALADAVLASEPPPEVRLEALLTKAAHHALRGADANAIEVATEGLDGQEAGPDAAPVVRELERIRIRSRVRGGDPLLAVEATTDPELASLFEEPELLGLRAVALDRASQPEAALPAYAAWRSVVPDDAPEALYAETRLRAIGNTLDAQSLRAAAESSRRPLAQRCLRGMAGETVRRGASDARTPRWVRDCAPASQTIGVLLPRTGPWSALADAQLSAASVATATLGISGGLVWRDSGSTPTQAASAARALVADGVDVIVGPIGPANVRAVAKAVGKRVRLVLPGEAVGAVIGVAPSLEQRLEALVEYGRAKGANRFMVAAPDNGYGRRAVKGIEASLDARERKGLIIRFYPPDTTSFAPTLSPLFPALVSKTVLLVPDHLTRVELLLRQLTRSAHGAAAHVADGPLVMSTAEGADPEAVFGSAKALEHLFVAPVAIVGGDTQEFAQAYRAAEGHPPSDQALLVYYALRAATSARFTMPEPAVRIVEEGALVPPS